MESDEQKLPAVIASIGFGDFWRGEFVRRFVNTGVFESVQPRVLNPLYADAGLTDPAGAYRITSYNVCYTKLLRSMASSTSS